MNSLGLGLVVAIVVAVAFWAGYLLRSPDSSPTSTQTYVILVRTQAPTPSETVTAWNAYEAAPQEAPTPEEAIAQFRRDSGLPTVEMKAIPLSDWRNE